MKQDFTLFKFELKKFKNKEEITFDFFTLNKIVSVFKFKEFKNKRERERENFCIIQFDLTRAQVYKVLNEKLEQKNCTKRLDKELKHSTKRSVFKLKKLKNKRENSFIIQFDFT